MVKRPRMRQKSNRGCVESSTLFFCVSRMNILEIHDTNSVLYEFKYFLFSSKIEDGRSNPRNDYFFVYSGGLGVDLYLAFKLLVICLTA